jgi:hypothetical protein
MRDVGVPKGVYNVVHGFGPESAGAFLTEHPGVNGVTFTGETGTGEAIMRAAAKGVRPVSFELGGKNPGIVFADADLDKAVAGITRSAFQNTGQVCLGTERIYVQRPIFDAFVARLKASAEALVLGPPETPGVTLGPLISQEHRNKVLSYYAKARGRRDCRYRRRHSGHGGRSCQRQLDRRRSGPGFPTALHWCAREASARAATFPLRYRRGSGRAGQCDGLWPCRDSVDRRHFDRARWPPRSTSVSADQQLVPARPAYGLRRFEAVGHWSRRRGPQPRILYRAQERLRQL